jgi:hypothetical protein
VRGEWVGSSEISANDVAEKLPKRFRRKFVALRQEAHSVIIDSRIVPAQFFESD